VAVLWGSNVQRSFERLSVSFQSLSEDFTLPIDYKVNSRCEITYCTYARPGLFSSGPCRLVQMTTSTSTLRERALRRQRLVLLVVV
jgi:hypothetical protein